MAMETVDLEQTAAETVIDNNMYIDKITELQANTVSKDKYAALQAENKKLLDTLTNGERLATKPEEPKYDIPALEKAYRDTFGMNSNLLPVKAALELRDAVLATTGKDLFVANANNPAFHAKQEAYDSANNVAELFRSCIKDCGGSDEVFTSLLRDRTDDDPTLLRTIANRNKK